MVAGLSRRFGGRIKGFARVGPDDEKLVELILQQALGAGISKVVFVVSEATRTPFQELFGSRHLGRPCRVRPAGVRPRGPQEAVGHRRRGLRRPRSHRRSVRGLQRRRHLRGAGVQASSPITWARSENAATVGFPLAKMLPEEGTVNRGVFELNDDGTLKAAAELFDLDRDSIAARGLTPDTICNVNLFGFHPPVLGMLGEVLASFKAEHAGDPAAECLLPTEIDGLVSSGKLVMEVYVSEEDWIGVTNPDDFQRRGEGAGAARPPALTPTRLSAAGLPVRRRTPDSPGMAWALSEAASPCATASGRRPSGGRRRRRSHGPRCPSAAGGGRPASPPPTTSRPAGPPG